MCLSVPCRMAQGTASRARTLSSSQLGGFAQLGFCHLRRHPEGAGQQINVVLLLCARAYGGMVVSKAF